MMTKTRYSVACDPCTISVLAFHPEGPSIELVITFPHDAPRIFVIPSYMSVQTLRRQLARHGGLVSHAKAKLIHRMLFDFCQFIIANHGWTKPFRFGEVSEESNNAPLPGHRLRPE